MELVSILTAVETAITDPEKGILKEISNLMSANGDSQKTQEAVFTLIGTVISLVIGIIKAAVGPAVPATGGQITDGQKK